MLNFIFVLLILLCGLAGYLLWRFQSQSPEAIMLKALEEKHREMIVGLNDSLNKLTDRLNLALSEQGKIQGEIIRDTMDNATNQLKNLLNMRLQDIDSKVKESLEEGFKKTNDTFDRVMKQLSTIDEAQKKIDGLTTNIVSFQELLGDKKSRGAFGEVQLEGLVRNALPPDAFSMQHTLSNGNRADCVLFLPEPTGSVAIDSKFPLESYRKMLDTSLPPDEIKNAQKQFKLDIKKHIHDIASKYIISNETSDGAVMFIPAEAVFAEIHAYHSDLIEEAMSQRVWLVSPTTLMAVLNTARAVLKDVETRKQVHIIKAELGRLGQEFERFDVRMKKLADNIRQAHEHAQDVHVTSQKISRRFSQIERVELKDDPNALLEFEEEIYTQQEEQNKDES
ncbi:COG1322 Predicted nuclease of restriction endonuclease-like fold, RmuC family [Candidatus Methylopumilus planktonicus]|jgi:DNA recombination protein RmuC|uniref:DNA recombination protein RmuC n=1 Tax=Candidatus Methylopumilus TaxID=1679002 RepID=UPI00111D20E1|nr:DNA recombination protein RmuC [Candidatus Methylopumilus universalis]QDC47358.1 DNA recombination protein RmuC [Candidatus Methylopumilus universalis]QDC71890.1 DNA recombination protein RmuC [Candidatus Methylopumilus universalis]